MIQRLTAAALVADIARALGDPAPEAPTDGEYDNLTVLQIDRRCTPATARRPKAAEC